MASSRLPPVTERAPNGVKRRPKIKDKKQSDRFKEAARQLGADESTTAFERVVEALASTKQPSKKD
jgi:hypothetical protein